MGSEVGPVAEPVGFPLSRALLRRAAKLLAPDPATASIADCTPFPGLLILEMDQFRPSSTSHPPKNLGSTDWLEKGHVSIMSLKSDGQLEVPVALFFAKGRFSTRNLKELNV